VTLVFDAIDSSTTRLDLSHIKFINEEARANHQGGWNNILDQLDQLI
jgi:hypothetical protein